MRPAERIMKYLLLAHVLLLPLFWWFSAPLVGYGIYASLVWGLPVGFLVGIPLYMIASALGEPLRGRVAVTVLAATCVWLLLLPLAAVLLMFTVVITALPRRPWRIIPIAVGAAMVLLFTGLELFGAFLHQESMREPPGLAHWSGWILLGHMLLVVTTAIFFCLLRPAPGEQSARPNS